MTWVRMFAIAVRLAWPHLLMPWRSPLVRWRMETYGCTDARGRLLHAEAIGGRDVARFLTQRRGELTRFLRWAASL